MAPRYGAADTVMAWLEAGAHIGGNTPRLSLMLCVAMPICFRLLVHCTRAAASRTCCTAGTSRPIRMAMMAITTSNSMRVKAGRGGLWQCDMVPFLVVPVLAHERGLPGQGPSGSVRRVTSVVGGMCSAGENGSTAPHTRGWTGRTATVCVTEGKLLRPTPLGKDKPENHREASKDGAGVRGRVQVGQRSKQRNRQSWESGAWCGA